MTDTALILIDIQNDYFPGGAMVCHESSVAGKNAGLLLDYARSCGIEPVHIRHISRRPNATFFLPGTIGAEISDLVSPIAGEKIIEKQYPNSFRQTELESYLQEKGIHNLIIAGMMSHMCIDATTRAAADLGFACILAHDACATRDLTFQEVTVPAPLVHAAYMSALSGLYARVLSTDEIIMGGIL
ncbi:cysteine hydrolase family protein [Methanospirillum hungatei]|uniref:cysteine hydrolase family protein n=1 Tax=Methanospirillum hungatei TaxID=2203 RepID=UPI0026EB3787|nr:cysteine hydrolase family protein [Methanospirillum hungatei]MCA1915876.1 cysteine hydrolase [Methanospirillum hungatei]